MKKDLNYYFDLLRMDAKVFNQQPDGMWEVSYKKLPNIIGKGFYIPEAERDLYDKAATWVKQAVENGVEAVKKDKGEAGPTTTKPCPFCGKKNITVVIAGSEGYVGCADCDYEFSVGEVDFDRRMPVENQARNLWNNMRPIETAYINKITELKARIAELEESKNGN